MSRCRISIGTVTRFAIATGCPMLCACREGSGRTFGVDFQNGFRIFRYCAPCCIRFRQTRPQFWSVVRSTCRVHGQGRRQGGLKAGVSNSLVQCPNIVYSCSTISFTLSGMNFFQLQGGKHAVEGDNDVRAKAGVYH